jgi:integrase
MTRSQEVAGGSQTDPLNSGQRNPRLRRRGPVLMTEMESVLEVCDRDATVDGPRDLALLLLAWRMGLGGRPIREARIDDLDGRHGTLRLQDPSREIRLRDDVKVALLRWIAVRGRFQGPLFCRTDGNRVGPEALQVGDLSVMFRRRSREAGIPGFCLDNLIATFNLLHFGEFKSRGPAVPRPIPFLLSRERETVVSPSGQLYFGNLSAEQADRIRYPLLMYLSQFRSSECCHVLRSLDGIASLLSHGRRNANTFDWTAIDEKAVRDLAAKGDCVNALGRRRVRSCLTGIAQQSRELGLSEERRYEGVVVSCRELFQAPPSVAPVSDHDVALVIRGCLRENSPLALRDATLICLSRECKLDGWEMAQLDYENLDTGIYTLLCPLLERTCQLSLPSRKVIERWLAVRGDNAGPLLSTLNSAGVLSFRRLRKTTVDEAIRRRGKQAGLRNFTASALRNANFWR